MDPALLQRLTDPACFPGHEQGPFTLVQTHLSLVCLGKNHVWKLKKPVHLPFADFSTKEKRKAVCDDELRLNRRLCPSLYLAVVPLWRDSDTWSFVSGDEVVDYAVLMERLPEERMLPRLLQRGEVLPEEIQELARIMARFHATARRDEDVKRHGDPARLARQASENFTETMDPGFPADSIAPSWHASLHEATARWFESRGPLLQDRWQAGFVREGHGDLHARNICLTHPPSIFDCLEFSEDFRCSDTATENAFLVMDLLYHGRRDLANIYTEAYRRESGDTGQYSLMPGLVSYRAMVRAKVALFTAMDRDVASKTRDEAKASALDHFLLATLALAESAAPFALVACGLPGSGKSTLLQELARRVGWHGESSDRIRKEMAGEPTDQTLEPQWYAPEISAAVYRQLRERSLHAGGGTPLLLDANFPRAELRRETLAALKMAGFTTILAWFDPPEPVVRERLAARAQSGSSESDADQAVYEKLARTFERPTPGEADVWWHVTETDVVKQIQEITELLFTQSGLLTRKE
jgi:uncharacterized protein